MKTPAKQSTKKKKFQRRLAHYLCNLDTPVEQSLRAQLVLAVLDVLQQGALTAELADELQAVSRTDAQDPDDVHVVQASQRHHVLRVTSP